jgi:hypothetical protein
MGKAKKQRAKQNRKANPKQQRQRRFPTNDCCNAR